MSLILLSSIVIRLLAFAGALVLLRRLRDWRVGFLAAMIGLMALRQILTLLEEPLAWTISLTAHVEELPGLIVSVFALLAVVFLERMIREKDEAADELASANERLAWEVAQRRKADEALRASLRREAMIFDIANDAVVSVNERQRITLFNKGAERIFGYAAEDVLGRPLDLLIPPRFHDAHRGHVRNFAAAGEPARTMNEMGEVVGRRSDGTEFPLEASISQVEIGGEKLLTAILRDITDRKRAEEERNRLVSLVENSGDFIGVATLEGQVLYLNEAAQRLVGLSGGEEVASTTVFDYFAESDLPTFRDEILPAMVEGGKWQGEFRFKHFRTGKAIPIEMNAFAINDPKSGRPVAIATVSRDITERRQHEAEVMQASKLATLGELATAVAHELNQPLSLIRMAAERAIDRLEGGDVEPAFLNERLERIVSQVERAAAIIDHMRIFGRPADEAKKGKTFDPRRPVEDAVSLMKEQLRLRNIEVRTDLPEVCFGVLGDEVQLEQVLLNLLSNARDAIEERFASARGQRVEARAIDLRIECSAPDKCVRITVRDTGGGIPESVMDRIFEPFVTTKEKGKGTGLGLSVSYGIITDMGGTIEARNVRGGAEFTIVLPAAPGGREEARGGAGPRDAT